MVLIILLQLYYASTIFFSLWGWVDKSNHISQIAGSMSVTGRSVAWNPHGKEDTQKLTQTDPLLSQLLSYVTSTHKEIDQSVYFSGMMSVVKFCNFFSGWNCCPYDTLQSELKMGRKQHPLNPTSALLWAPLRAEKHLKNGEFQSISKKDNN